MARVPQVGIDHWKAMTMAVEENVKIALGTDQFPFEPNDGTTATIREAEYYLEAGMTPLQALQAATIQPARMLDIEQAAGSLTVGKLADIVAIDGNPLEDFKALRSLGFVMKGGYVYRNDWGDAMRGPCRFPTKRSRARTTTIRSEGSEADPHEAPASDRTAAPGPHRVLRSDQDAKAFRWSSRNSKSVLGCLPRSIGRSAETAFSAAP